MEPAPPTVTANPAGGPARARWDRWLQAHHRQPAVAGSAAGRTARRSTAACWCRRSRSPSRPGLSWALAAWLLSSPSPIWAPITASLIALLTVRASIRDAVEKIVAVLIGIAVAIWLGGLIGLHAWSIAVIVAVGFLVGKVLRLNGGAAAQIPINGLFVLGPGQRRRSRWATGSWTR